MWGAGRGGKGNEGHMCRSPWQALCRRERGAGDTEGFLWWPRVHLVECSCHAPLLTYRCLLHCHPVIPLEGVRHHLGQLSPPLCPQVPAETVLPTQLLEAHFLSCRAASGRASGLRRSPRRRSSSTRTSRLCWTVQSWLAHEASLRRHWAPNGDGTLVEPEGGT